MTIAFLRSHNSTCTSAHVFVPHKRQQHAQICIDNCIGSVLGPMLENTIKDNSLLSSKKFLANGWTALHFPGSFAIAETLFLVYMFAVLRIEKNIYTLWIRTGIWMPIYQLIKKQLQWLISLIQKVLSGQNGKAKQSNNVFAEAWKAYVSSKTARISNFQMMSKQSMWLLNQYSLMIDRWQYSW